MSRQIQIGSKRKYDQSAVELAVLAVQSKAMSLRAASRSYAIPRATLFDKVNNRVPMVAAPKTVLTPAEEQTLVDWTLHMGRIGFV